MLLRILPALLLAGAAMPARAVAQDGATHLVIISGLSGEERFAKSFVKWGADIVRAATEKYGVSPANVVWLAETADVHPAVKARAAKDVIDRELRAIAARAGANDRVMIVLFGHGSYQSNESRIGLPGPDLNSAQLDSLLDLFPTQRIAVINTSSSSGGFIKDLAAPNRVIVTATKSHMEANETVFGGYFAAAYATDGADVDKDGRVSLLEAYDYARAEVEREYKRGGKMMTEHAVLDGTGDGKGVAAVETTSPHARLARSFYMGSRTVTASGKPVTPELRKLYEDKARIESALDDLRAKKESMAQKEYEDALEKLLIDLSLNAQAIRKLEGSAP
jgi:hypothetical protein